MEAFISNEVLDGIKAARQKAERKKNRLRVHVGEDVYPIVKYWRTGFSVDLDTVPKLRGLVDLYDGGRHLSQCLIIRADKNGERMNYEFKRRTEAVENAALDYEVDDDAPIALLK